MFEVEMSESGTNRVKIDDIEPDVMKVMLAYIYSMNLENIDEMSYSLLKATDKVSIHY